MPPKTPERPGARTAVRMGLVLGAAAVLLGLALALGRLATDEDEARPADGPAGGPSVAVKPPSEPAAPRAPPPAVQAPAPLPSDGEALSAALGEERVVLASSMLIEELDRDREWVCAGESITLSARVGGVPEPGADYRWLWRTAGGGVELEPGPRLHWQAPEAAGRYPVRFQIGTDLGGRRVGVLAEREVEIEVRSCGEGEGQAGEPLRLGVRQGLRGAFSFQAEYRGRESLQAYVWDLGDGTTRSTTGPLVEHTYPVKELGPDESRSYTAKLTVRLEGGGTLEARAFVVITGQPATDEPLPVAMELSRWRPRPKGAGWQSELVMRGEPGSDVTWERLERTVIDWNGKVEVSRRDWREVIRVEEELGQGSFRGQVTVSPAESAANIKQVLDTLYGRDATGKEVVMTWSPYKAEAPPVPPPPVPEEEAPPGK